MQSEDIAEYTINISPKNLRKSRSPRPASISAKANHVKRSCDKNALLHHTGGGNLGDDATLDVVISSIRQRRPAAEISVLSMNPEDTEQRHGVPSLPIRRHTWGIGYSSEKGRLGQAERHGLLDWLRTARTPAIRLPRAIFAELAFLATSYRNLRGYGQLVS